MKFYLKLFPSLVLKHSILWKTFYVRMSVTSGVVNYKFLVEVYTTGVPEMRGDSDSTIRRPSRYGPKKIITFDP